MARQPWVAQIRNARTPAEQIVTLKALKNEIVGHPLKKELATIQGVLEPVVRLAFNKAGSRQDGKSHDHGFASRPMIEEEQLRLQGLQVVASVALGIDVHILLLRHMLMVTRRSTVSRPFASCSFSTGDTVESLPFEQPFAISPGIPPSFIEPGRLGRFGFQHTFFELKYDSRESFLTPEPQFAMPDTVSDFHLLECPNTDITCGIFDKSGMSGGAPSTSLSKFGSSRCSCYKVGKLRCC